jgi:hypothetical protein
MYIYLLNILMSIYSIKLMLRLGFFFFFEEEFNYFITQSKFSHSLQFLVYITG